MSKLQPFYDFINSQKDGKRINNNYGWQKCAVGEYVRKNINITQSEFCGEIRTFLVTFWEVNPDLYQELNHSKYKSYGKLKERIKTVSNQ